MCTVDHFVIRPLHHLTAFPFNCQHLSCRELTFPALRGEAGTPVGAARPQILPRGSLCVRLHCSPHLLRPKETKMSVKAFDCLFCVFRQILIPHQGVTLWWENLVKGEVSEHLAAKTSGLQRLSFPPNCCSRGENCSWIADQVQNLYLAPLPNPRLQVLPELRNVNFFTQTKI